MKEYDRIEMIERKREREREREREKEREKDKGRKTRVMSGR
jgi:hypothetical protein